MHSATAANAHFPHRNNPDGTIDAICPRCYVTIGTASCEPDLSRMESAHVCDPVVLEHFHPVQGGSERSEISLVSNQFPVKARRRPGLGAPRRSA